MAVSTSVSTMKRPRPLRNTYSSSQSSSPSSSSSSVPSPPFRHYHHHPRHQRRKDSDSITPLSLHHSSSSSSSLSASSIRPMKRHRTPTNTPFHHNRRAHTSKFREFTHSSPSLNLPSSSALSSASLSDILGHHGFLNHICTNNDDQNTPALPDEVLVCIFQFIPTATGLARLRLVCSQWRQVIDETPVVWRWVSFRKTCFTRRVISHPYSKQLGLGPIPGARAISIAARSGNEWARFLFSALFSPSYSLHAFTAPQPLASLLVLGRIARTECAFPPRTSAINNSTSATATAMSSATTLTSGAATGTGVSIGSRSDVWLAVHAAKKNATLLPLNSSDSSTACPSVVGDNWPHGAVVGVIHVSHALLVPGKDSQLDRWIWHIDRAVSLKKPLRCAGFLGLWPTSQVLSDLLIRAMHNQ